MPLATYRKRAYTVHLVSVSGLWMTTRMVETGQERSGGKVGRGSENKVPFIAAVKTSHEGHPLRAVFSRVTTFSSHDVDQWAKSHLAPTALVVSDGLNCFGVVTNTGCSHQREVVGISTDMACFDWINTMGNTRIAIWPSFISIQPAVRSTQHATKTDFRLCLIGKRPEAWLRKAENWA